MNTREIKFRVWDTKYNCFSEEPYFRLLLANNGKVYNSENDEWHEPKTRYIIQFFTGLCDKNGKEIYEGDIVRSWYSRDMSGMDIVTVLTEVKFEVNYESSGFEIPFLERSEVIGNIYENPELLKP